MDGIYDSLDENMNSFSSLFIAIVREQIPNTIF